MGRLGGLRMPWWGWALSSDDTGVVEFVEALIHIVIVWRSIRDSGRVALRARTLIDGGAISEIPETGAGLSPYSSYSEDAFLKDNTFLREYRRQRLR